MKLLSAIFPALALCALLFCTEVPAQSASRHIAPLAGVWSVKGKDADGIVWNAKLRISKRQAVGRKVALGGHFDWISADRKTSGREFIRGTFEIASGKMTLRGYAVRIRRGEIMKTRYAAYGYGRGRKIKGTWSGKDVVKGTWTARWSRPN